MKAGIGWSLNKVWWINLFSSVPPKAEKRQQEFHMSPLCHSGHSGHVNEHFVRSRRVRFVPVDSKVSNPPRLEFPSEELGSRFHMVFEVCLDHEMAVGQNLKLLFPW